jgi:hypothetical protein
LDGVEASFVRNVKVGDPVDQATVALRRSLAANDVVVTYEVIVGGASELITTQTSMDDFAAGGAASLTKLAASLEAVSPGSASLMVGATMVAKIEGTACATTCPSSDSRSDLTALGKEVALVATFMICIAVGFALWTKRQANKSHVSTSANSQTEDPKPVGMKNLENALSYYSLTSFDVVL